MIITGGSNRNNADVDTSNRLRTRSINSSSFTDAVVQGRGLAILTGDITLTSATESILLNYKNDENQDLIVEVVDVSLSDSVGGTTETVSVLTRLGIGLAMTGGSGVDAVVINLIAGAPAQFDHTSEIGQEGAASTDPVAITLHRKTGNDRQFRVLGILPKGASLMFSVIPPPGNTSMVVSVSVTGYLREE